ANGANQPQPPCATACSGDGTCTGDCQPGATRCAAGATNQLETCDAAGHWAPAGACTFVCDPTTQKCGGECAPGAPSRCSGNAVQTCDATGHWQGTTA